METIEVKKESAERAIKAAHGGAPMAEILQILFDQPSKSLPALERIFTFEQACADQGYQPGDPRFTDNTPHINAVNKVELVIIPALREGWEPDWNDGDQAKWYGWYYMNDPGLRFVDARCAYQGSRVGSRRVLPSREHEEHLAKHFLNILKDYYS